MTTATSTTGLDPGPSRTTGRDTRWSALVVIAVAQLMVALDATIVNIALPSAQQDLGFGDARPDLGRHRLHLHARRAAAARRPGRRPVRPPARVPGRPRRVRRGVRPRGLRARPRHPGRGSRPAGRLRRDPDPDRAVAGRDHLHRTARAGPGVRRVRRRRLERRSGRAAARRRPDRVRRLALVPVRQRRRRRGRVRRRPRRAPPRRRLPRGAPRHRLRCPGHDRPGRDRARLRPRRHRGLGLRAGARPGGGRRRAGGRVPGPADPDRRSRCCRCGSSPTGPVPAPTLRWPSPWSDRSGCSSC